MILIVPEVQIRTNFCWIKATSFEIRRKSRSCICIVVDSQTLIFYQQTCNVVILDTKSETLSVALEQRTRHSEPIFYIIEKNREKLKTVIMKILTILALTAAVTFADNDHWETHATKDEPRRKIFPDFFTDHKIIVGWVIFISTWELRHTSSYSRGILICIEIWRV